jgi:hypothetical protein
MGVQGSGKIINWMDFGFNNTKSDWYDSELTRLSFIKDVNIKDNWNWPTSGKQQHWDAVGFIDTWDSPSSETNNHVILVEAKAHIDEPITSCKAGFESSRRIAEILEQTAIDLHVNDYGNIKSNWLNKYYQQANRLATYNYLKRCGLLPHLIFIYFLNDQYQGKKCPSRVSDWEEYLLKQDEEMGIKDIFINERVYNLFLEVKSDKKCWTSSSQEYELNRLET